MYESRADSDTVSQSHIVVTTLQSDVLGASQSVGATTSSSSETRRVSSTSEEHHNLPDSGNGSARGAHSSPEDVTWLFQPTTARPFLGFDDPTLERRYVLYDNSRLWKRLLVCSSPFAFVFPLFYLGNTDVSYSWEFPIVLANSIIVMGCAAAIFGVRVAYQHVDPLRMAAWHERIGCFITSSVFIAHFITTFDFTDVCVHSGRLSNVRNETATQTLHRCHSLRPPDYGVVFVYYFLVGVRVKWAVPLSVMTYAVAFAALPFSTVVDSRAQIASRGVLMFGIFAVATALSYWREATLRHGFLQEVALRRAEHRARQYTARIDALVKSLLPPSVLQRLAAQRQHHGNGAVAIFDATDECTVSVTTVGGFAEWCCRRPSVEVAQMLFAVVSLFDDAAKRRGVDKIATFGDAYWAVSGLLDACDDHATRICALALDMTDAFAHENRCAQKPWKGLASRCGVASGTTYGMVLGSHQISYETLGPAHDAARRLALLAPVGRVLVASSTHVALQAIAAESFRLVSLSGGDDDTPIGFVLSRRSCLREADGGGGNPGASPSSTALVSFVDVVSNDEAGTSSVDRRVVARALLVDAARGSCVMRVAAPGSGGVEDRGKYSDLSLERSDPPCAPAAAHERLKPFDAAEVVPQKGRCSCVTGFGEPREAEFQAFDVVEKTIPRRVVSAAQGLLALVFAVGLVVESGGFDRSIAVSVALLAVGALLSAAHIVVAFSLGVANPSSSNPAAGKKDDDTTATHVAATFTPLRAVAFYVALLVARCVMALASAFVPDGSLQSCAWALVWPCFNLNLYNTPARLPRWVSAALTTLFAIVAAASSPALSLADNLSWIVLGPTVNVIVEHLLNRFDRELFLKSLQTKVALASAADEESFLRSVLERTAPRHAVVDLMSLADAGRRCAADHEDGGPGLITHDLSRITVCFLKLADTNPDGSTSLSNMAALHVELDELLRDCPATAKIRILGSSVMLAAGLPEKLPLNSSSGNNGESERDDTTEGEACGQLLAFALRCMFSPRQVARQDSSPSAAVAASLPATPSSGDTSSGDTSSGGDTGSPQYLAVSCGIHTGPLTAAIFGSRRMTYDLVGDTVNAAHRCWMTAPGGVLHVTSAAVAAARTAQPLVTEREAAAGRREVTMVGKGSIPVVALDRRPRPPIATTTTTTLPFPFRS